MTEREYAIKYNKTSRIYVVIDTDQGIVVRAFRDDIAAEDFADEYYAQVGNDCRVDRCVLVEE